MNPSRRALCGLALACLMPAIPGTARERTSDSYTPELIARSDGAEVLAARNPAHEFSARFGERGVEVTPQGSEASLSLTLVAAGRGDVLAPVPPSAPIATARRVEYCHGDMTEWYVNSAAGLEHGFTLASPLSGSPSQPLRLELLVGGPYAASAEAGGQSVRLEGTRGSDVLRYEGLVCWDDDGRRLPAFLLASGDRIAVIVDDAGATYPVTIDPTVVNDTARLQSSDPATQRTFGDPVAMHGDTILITDDDYSEVVFAGGIVHVFEKPPGGWSGDLTPVARLMPSDIEAWDGFGSSMAIWGDTVVVGLPRRDFGGVDSAGVVYVFVRPPGGWLGDHTETAILVAADREAGAEGGFGGQVDIWENTVVVGSGSWDVIHPARVFEKPPGGWAGEVTESARLHLSDADVSAAILSIRSDTVVVGNAQDLARLGLAHVFVKPDTGWSGDLAPAAILEPGDGLPRDYFGGDVSVEDGMIVVGAHQESNNDRDRWGAAYVFLRPPGGWKGRLFEQAKLIASDRFLRQVFATRLDTTGKVIAVQAKNRPTAHPADPGAAYVFCGAPIAWQGEHEETHRLVSRAVLGGAFPGKLEVSDGVVTVGLPRMDAEGHALLFELPEECMDEDCANGLDDDGDGVMDCADADCVLTSSCNAADQDSDGATNFDDCDPIDASLSDSPPVVDDLRVRKLGATLELTWTDLTLFSGPTTVHDVATGTLGDLHADRGFPRATCAADGNDLSEARFVDSRDLGVPGDDHYYLVRGQNDCRLGGTGPWGSQRVTRACP